MEHGILNSVSETDGDDFQQLQLFSIDRLVEMENPDSPISKMLEYWLDLRQPTSPIPRAGDLRFDRLWRMKIPDRVTISDCAPDDPRHFKVIRHASDVGNRPGIFGGSMSGQPFGGLPSPMLGTSLQNDYAIAKSDTAIPSLRYQRVKQRINGVHRDYMRLLLPFADARGNVSQLAAVHRRLSLVYFQPDFVPRIE